jgi:ribonuclease HI
MGNNTVSNVYAAELLGVHMALAMAVRHGGAQRFKKIWVFTDNQAAILSTYRPRAQSGQYILRRIWDQYTELTEQGVEVEIRWIPSHEGVPGNEQADDLAKRAAGWRPAPGNKNGVVAAAYRAAQLEWVKCLKSACKRKYKLVTSAWWLKNWQSGTTGREYYKIANAPSKGLLAARNKVPKALGSIITQMRTGKIGLRSYLQKINRADTDECECGRGTQTVRHVITECPNFSEL